MKATGKVTPARVAPNEPTIDTTLIIRLNAGKMVGSLGATLAGVTFPVVFMDAPVYAVSFLFPIRHFMEVVDSLLYLDGTFTDYGMNLVFLMLFILLPLLLLPRLKHALTTHHYDAIE